MVQNKKRIISLILMLTLLVSSLVVGAITASAADTDKTASVKIQNYASSNGWSSGTKYTKVDVDDNITATVSGSTNTGKYYSSGNDWRLYQTENPTLTLTAGDDYTISSVKITYNSDKTGVLKYNSNNVTSGTTVNNINADTVTFSVGNSGSATNGQVRITAIDVTYTSTSGGSGETGGEPGGDVGGDEVVGTEITVTMKHSSTNTTNITDYNDNHAATFGLDSSIFTVTADKGSANDVGLNKDGDFRLYYNVNGSNKMTVDMADGYIIKYIEITFTGTGYSKCTVSANGSVIKTTGNTTSDKIDINANSFEFANGNTSNVQVRIKSVKIVYVNNNNVNPEPEQPDTPVCDHNYVGVPTKNPTCTEKGTTTYTCSKCNDYYTEEISALDHTYSESVTKEVTCTINGVKTLTCSGCGNEKTETIKAEGHKFNYGDVCTVCNKTAITVKFKANGKVVYTKTVANQWMTVATMPDAPVLSGNYSKYTFAGWVLSEIDTETDLIPTKIYGAGEENVKIDETADEVCFYAVYTFDVEGEGTSDFEITDISDIKPTDLVIITMTVGGEVYALTFGNGTRTAPVATKVTVSNGIISNPIDTLYWNISNDNGVLTIYYANGKKDLWLYCNNDNNGVRVGTNDNKTFIIDSTYGYLFNEATSRYIGVYSKQDWRCYAPEPIASNNSHIRNQTLGFYVQKSATTTYYVTNLDCEHEYDEGVETQAPNCTEAGEMTYTCSCGSSYTDKIEATGHTGGTATCTAQAVCTRCQNPYGELDANNHASTETYILNDKAADCVNPGYTGDVYHKCCNVLKESGEEINALGHTAGETVVENNNAPDCVNDGSYDNVTYCTVCGTQTSRETITVDALGHTAGEVKVENKVDPDCESAGSYENVTYCTVCGTQTSRETITVDALGHEWSETLSSDDNGHWYACERTNCTAKNGETEHNPVELPKKDATCTESGLKAGIKCSECDKILRPQEEIPAGHTAGAAATCTTAQTCTVCGTELNAKLGHDLKDVDGKAATCTEDGYTAYKDCSRCDYIEGKTTLNKGHDLKDIAQKDATCTEDGYTAHQACSKCDYTEGKTTLNKGHALTQVEAKAATCTAIGWNAYEYCSACDYTTYVEIPVKGHTAGEVKVENNVPADCVNAGSYDNVTYCTVCKVETSRETITVDALGHTDGEVQVENRVESTCTVAGSYENVVYCSVCKTHEISRTKVDLPLAAHNYSSEVTAPTCTAQGYTTYTCACGDTYKDNYVDATNHNYVGEVTTAPTCTEKGVKTYTCSKCNDSYTEEIAAKGHSATCAHSVAYIGTTYYASLQAAVDAATTGDTVVLMKDIALTNYLHITTPEMTAREITIDLASHTISEAENYTYEYYPLVFVGVNQKVTITGNGTITAKANTTIGVYGELVIENGKFINEGTTDKDAALHIWYWNYKEEQFGDTFKRFVGGHGIINGGEFVGAVYCDANTSGDTGTSVSLTINGGTFNANAFFKNVDGSFGYTSIENAIVDAKNGATITLLKDVALAGKNLYISGKTVILDLNGKTITADWATDGVCEVLLVDNGATVTITGNGTMISGNQATTNSVVSVLNESKLTIENGTFISNNIGDVIFAKYNSTINIEGGYYEAKNSLDGMYFVLDIDENYEGAATDTSKIIVTGGTFVKFNPANHSNDGKDYTNKVAEGYLTTKNGDVYTVTKFVLEAGKEIKLEGDLVVKEILLANGTKIDLNGYTLTASAVVSVKADSYIYDSTGLGKLIVPQDKLGIVSGDYKQVPVWYDGGYYFRAPVNQAKPVTTGNGTFELQFRPSFAIDGLKNDPIQSSKVFGAADNNITYAVYVVCYGGEGYITDLQGIDAELVKDVYTQKKSIKITVNTSEADYTHYDVVLVVMVNGVQVNSFTINGETNDKVDNRIPAPEYVATTEQALPAGKDEEN